MEKLIGRLVHYCLINDYVSKDDAPWLQYALEKKISTGIISIPFLLIAVIRTSAVTGVSFMLSFFFLRSYINGYHAKTVLGCFTLSLLFELLIIESIHPLLTPMVALLLVICLSAIIFLFAPYRHPNMHLSDGEFAACSQKAKQRIVTIGVISLLLYGIKKHEILFGVSLGTAMAAVLLLCAYITEERRKKHESDEESF